MKDYFFYVLMAYVFTAFILFCLTAFFVFEYQFYSRQRKDFNKKKEKM